jgi:hypothetical protein
VGRPRCESGESEPGTHEVRVHAIRLGGRRRLDASRAFSTVGSQDLSVAKRALARKKSVAPPDAERGRAEGETVRVSEAINHFLSHGLRVSACRLSIRQKAFSGFCPPCFHRQGDAKSSGSQIYSTSASAGRKVGAPMKDSASGGHGFRLGRGCG